VGRADRVTGPYVDEDGMPLARGGGRVLLAGDARWHGVGHCGVYDFDGTTWLIFHGYDATARGQSKLRLEKITWTDAGWPRVEISNP